MSFLSLMAIGISCDEGKPVTTNFSYSEAAGIWKIYESETDDGVINTSDLLHSMNLFGAYNGDVQLHANQRYTPLNRDSQGAYSPEPAEEGTYEYIAATNTLVFSSSSERTYTLIKFTDDELHIKKAGVTYKLRRQ